MNLYTYISRVERADEPVKDGALAELRDNEAEISDMQEESHHKGYDREGEEFGRYEDITEILSGGRKKAGELYNLHDEGDFHDDIYVEVSDDGSYTIGSRDSKETMLERILTKTMWGFKDLEPIWEIVRWGIINELNKLHR